jgi:membrane protein YqaA with SNARE-associated domain
VPTLGDAEGTLPARCRPPVRLRALPRTICDLLRRDRQLTDLLAYAGLFAAALAGATLLPMQSEAVLVALLLADAYPSWLLIAVASAGNILGSVINWGLGRGIERLRHRPWFPVGAKELDRAQAWYVRRGKWSLLLSWMPIVGDPLTVVAGVLREPFPTFLALVAVAKIGRYLVLAAITLGLS